MASQPQFNKTIADFYKQKGLRSPWAQDDDDDPADLKDESIWAGDDGKFDDWTK